MGRVVSRTETLPPSTCVDCRPDPTSVVWLPFPPYTLSYFLRLAGGYCYSWPCPEAGQNWCSKDQLREAGDLFSINTSRGD